MDACETRMISLVDLDDDKTGNQCEEPRQVESEMNIRAKCLLLRGIGRLQDEDALCEEEDSGGIEKLWLHQQGVFPDVWQSYWMSREKDKVLHEDR